MDDASAGAATDQRARFEAVYEAYSGLILAYAVRRTANAEDAADVVAETFATAWRRVADLPPGDEVRPWLYGVARRVLLNHQRTRRRRARLVQRLASDVHAVVEVGAVGPDLGSDREVIAAAFSRLATDDQELLRLVGWDGLSRDDIATALGTSRAVVRVRLHRARRRFARALAEAGVQRSVSAGHGSAGRALARPNAEESR